MVLPICSTNYKNCQRGNIFLILVAPVSDSADSQEQTQMPRWVSWLVFNLRTKKIGSVSPLHNYTVIVTVAHPCSSLKADWVFFSYPPHDMGPLGCFPRRWLGLAIFSLAAQILLPIKVQKSRTNKSHRGTSQLKQHTTQHSNYTHAHSSSFHIHTGELKRPVWPKYFCWAQHHLYGVKDSVTPS
jgi:hypothetical protein